MVTKGFPSVLEIKRSGSALLDGLGPSTRLSFIQIVFTALRNPLSVLRDHKTPERIMRQFIVQSFNRRGISRFLNGFRSFDAEPTWYWIGLFLFHAWALNRAEGNEVSVGLSFVNLLAQEMVNATFTHCEFKSFFHFRGSFKSRSWNLMFPVREIQCVYQLPISRRRAAISTRMEHH